MLHSIVTVVLMIVEVLTCLLLLSVILIQRSKSQGMGLAFGAGMGEQMFGSQVGNVLTRATVVLAIVFLVNTTLLGLMGTGRRERSVADSVSSIPAPMAIPQAGPVPVPAPAVGGEFAPVAMEGTPEPDMAVAIPSDASTPAPVVGDAAVVPMAAVPAVEPVAVPEPATLPAATAGK